MIQAERISRKRDSSGGGGGDRNRASSKRTKAILIDAAGGGGGRRRGGGGEDEDLFGGKDVNLSTDYDPISLDELTGTKVIKYDPLCPLCKTGFGKPKDTLKHPRMARLWALLAENINKVHPTELYQRFSECQIKLFVKDYKKCSSKIKAKLPGPCSPEMAQAHFEEHCYFMETELDHIYSKLRGYVKFLADHVGNRDRANPDRISPNDLVGKQYLSAIKELKDTWKMVMAERRR